MTAGEQKAGDVIPEVNRRLQQLLDDYWAQQGKKLQHGYAGEEAR